jgi:hypothetical protein
VFKKSSTEDASTGGDEDEDEDEEGNTDSKLSEFRQKKREIDIATNLVERVDNFVSGEMKLAEYRESCIAEAKKIGEGSFGAAFLAAIGFALEIESEEFLGFQQSFLGLDGHAARAKKRVHSVSENFSIAGAGLKAINKGRAAQKDFAELERQQTQKHAPVETVVEGNRETDSSIPEGEVPPPAPEAEKRTRTETEEAEAAALLASKLDESLPVILNLAWAINARDISKTLKSVCKKVFCDADVSKEVRIKRAEGARVLGEAFGAVGKSLGGAGAMKNVKSDDIKQRAEVAMATTMAKAQGQEMDENDAEDMIKEAKRMKAEHEEMDDARKKAMEDDA